MPVELAVDERQVVQFGAAQSDALQERGRQERVRFLGSALVVGHNANGTGAFAQAGNDSSEFGVNPLAGRWTLSYSDASPQRLVRGRAHRALR